MVFPILGANTESAAYEIQNSLRFNTADDAFMQRTFTAGTRTKFTISCWIKRGNLSGKPNDDPHRIIDAFKDANNVSNFFFETDDTLRFFHKSAGTTYANVVTNRVFRDPSAWYHLVCAVDTTQSTESNRIKFYVNGVQETSFSTYSVLEDLATFFNDNTRICTVGAKDSSSGEKDHFDGYMADFYYVDNQQYDQTYFGKTNDNGVWIPVEKGKGAGGDLTFGTNGFFLEFQQTGTSANSSGMGADTSGNDLHLTPNNLAAIDVTTDTPTNNFNTLNPLANAMGGTLSEGNLKCVGVNAADRHVFGTFGLTRGKWYWEVKVTDQGARGSIWVSDSDHEDVIGTNYAGHSFWSGGTPTSGTSNSNVGSGASDNDILCFAVDLDNGKLDISKNADIDTSGTAEITGLATSGTNRDYRISQRETGNPASTMQHNYGNAPFSISSGNSDANGYGNFEYAVPSGYYSLCTKNLAEYG